MIEDNTNYQDMTQGVDRITDILRRQSTPMVSSPIASQASPLPVNILNALAAASNSYGSNRGGDFMSAVQNYQTNQQNQEINQQKMLLNAYETKLKMGDAQTKALDDKLALFTGNDPEGKAMFLEALHADPEDIDPSNSYQIMTKLAGIKKKLGYESPDLRMSKEKDQLDLDYKRSQINANNSLADLRSNKGRGDGGGASGQKPPSGYRFTADGQSLEAIPGGPGEKIAAELSARLGLANKFLGESGDIKEQLRRGKATGAIDYAVGAVGRGVSGKIQRRVEDGADALQRMLTGAGMPVSEATNYANRFKITYKDDAATAVDKIDNLEKNLQAQIEMSMRGRGSLPEEQTGGVTPKTPAGVDPADWEFMTPEERALFE